MLENRPSCFKNTRRIVVFVSASVPVLFRNGYNIEKDAKKNRMLPRPSSSCQRDEGPSSTRDLWTCDPRYEETNLPLHQVAVG